MAVIELLDQAEFLISTNDDPTSLASNIDQPVGAGTVASTVDMLVMPYAKFFGYIGHASLSPRATPAGSIPGNPATGGTTQYAVYARTLTYDASGALLTIGKFTYSASSSVGS